MPPFTFYPREKGNCSRQFPFSSSSCRHTVDSLKAPELLLRGLPACLPLSFSWGERILRVFGRLLRVLRQDEDAGVVHQHRAAADRGIGVAGIGGILPLAGAGFADGTQPAAEALHGYGVMDGPLLDRLPAGGQADVLHVLTGKDLDAGAQAYVPADGEVGAAGIAGVSSLISATTDSVVRSVDAIEVAF